MSTYADLLDWRRRVDALYADVRRMHADDPVAAHGRWRGVRDDLFATHPASPLPPQERDGFAGLPVAPYDPELVLEAPVEPLPHERFPIASSTGGEMAFVRFGAVELPIGRLEVFWLDAYGGGLFVPFTDATCGEATYGGGRYLIDTAKGADLGSTDDGALILDLNFAYHPSCFHAPDWSCPLAPPSNRLPVPVVAGELAAGPA